MINVIQKNEFIGLSFDTSKDNSDEENLVIVAKYFGLNNRIKESFFTLVSIEQKDV